MTTIIPYFDPILGKLRNSDVALISLATLIVPDPLVVNNLIVNSNASINTLKTNAITNTSTISTNGLGLNFAQWNSLTSLGPLEGLMNWSSLYGTIQLGLAGGNVDVPLGLTTNLPKRVRNSTGSTMPKGTAVYLNGVSGNTPLVERALATGDRTSAFTIGMTAEDIANNATGWVTSFGLIRGVDTSSFTSGDTLYLSGATAGSYTNVPTKAPIHYVRVGTVTKASADGEIIVNVINGYELDELHNVIIASLASGQILQSGASSYWYSRSLASAVNDFIVIPTLPSLGSLAVLNSLSYYALDSRLSLGSLAVQNNLSYFSLDSRLSLGSLAVLNDLSYTSLINLPALGSLALQNTLSYYALDSKLSLGSLAVLNNLSYYALDSRLSLGSLAVRNNISYFSLDSRLSLGSLALVSNVVSPLVLSGVTLSLSQGAITHNNLAGLTTGDPHTQYLYLNNRGTTQTVNDSMIVKKTQTSGTLLELQHTTTGYTGDSIGAYFNITDITGGGKTIYAHRARMDYSGATTIAGVQATSNQLYVSGGGNVNFAEILTSNMNLTNGSTVDDASMIKIYTPSQAIGTSITTLRGLYLENMSGALNNYSIYSEGGTMYHSGAIQVGDGYYEGNSNSGYLRQRTAAEGDIISGATSTSFQLSTTNGEIQFVRANGSTLSPQMLFKKSRGTADYPLVNSTGDDAGMIRFYSFISNASTGGYDEVARITVDTVGAPDAGAYRIYTANAGAAVLERLTINPNGFIGVATASPSVAFDVNGNARVRSITAGTYTGPINRTSDGTFTTATSDIRFKKDIETIPNALDKVTQLRGITYNWKDTSAPKRMMGMIAQEVKEIVPELVFQNDSDGYYGMFYGETTALLVEAIKEQQAIIKDLKTRIEVLEAK